MKNKTLIKKASRFARKSLEHAEGGHDWLHVRRVLKNAEKILERNKANKTTVFLGLIFHDLADQKFDGGANGSGKKLISAFFDEMGVQGEKREQVMDIVENISYNGGFDNKASISKELKVARDADRLDALGAIGVARAFHYGGFRKRKMYDPEVKPVKYSSAQDYRENAAPTINHFYEKLLHLRKGMYTKRAKSMAKKRHRFLVAYLREFHMEIKGRA